MDSVRLGQVLGRGARGAARTLVSAIDAATANNPRPAPSTSPTRPASPSPATPGSAAVNPVPLQPQLLRSPAQRVVETPLPRAAVRPNLAEGGRRFGRAVWSPFVRLSGVLWLEFTGVFFGVFALSAAIGAWRLHAALHAPASDPARTHFLLAVAVAAVFAYFCVSSFVRAARRGRRA